MKLLSRFVLFLGIPTLLTVSLASCGDPECVPSCVPGLQCRSDVCVDPGSTGGSGGTRVEGCVDLGCDDQNDCTTDTCDPADGKCIHDSRADGAECDAGEGPGFCTASVCEPSHCLHSDCYDGNECTFGFCGPMGCEYTYLDYGTSCSFDGFPGMCGLGSFCESRLCAGVECDDENECTDDSCDPSNGECVSANLMDGMSCDFGGLPGICTAGVCEDAS